MRTRTPSAKGLPGVMGNSANSNKLAMSHTNNADTDGTEIILPVLDNNSTPMNTQNLDAADFVIV